METGRCITCGAHRIIKINLCKRCRMGGKLVEEEEEQ
jgi:hypothetical protein